MNFEKLEELRGMSEEEHEQKRQELREQKYLYSESNTIKYRRPGIYCIKIDGDIVYVGKSKNMQGRLSEHIRKINSGIGENKYKVLHEARQQGKTIQFDVLEYANLDDLTDRENYYIGLYNPKLNFFNPNGANKKAKSITYEELEQELENDSLEQRFLQWWNYGRLEDIYPADRQSKDR